MAATSCTQQSHMLHISPALSAVQALLTPTLAPRTFRAGKKLQHTIQQAAMHTAQLSRLHRTSQINLSTAVHTNRTSRSSLPTTFASACTSAQHPRRTPQQFCCFSFAPHVLLQPRPNLTLHSPGNTHQSHYRSAKSRSNIMQITEQ